MTAGGLPGSPRFALNHIVAPRMGYRAFFDLAVALEIEAVELRNEMDGTAIKDGTRPEAIRDAAETRKLTIVAINALRRFNEWNGARIEEARALAAYARDCGAKAIVICPVNDASFRPMEPERITQIREALGALKPILADAGVRGLIEVVGFPHSSLSRKHEAIDAIDAVRGNDVFQIVHDSFHHFLAKEHDIIPRVTGLVHISGVIDAADVKDDKPRTLVDTHDVMDTIGQMATLLNGGYRGFFSFEPFSPAIHALDDPAGAIRRSIDFIQNRLRGRPYR